MASLLKFPYRRFDSKSFLIYRPEVELTVSGLHGAKSILALCDTGADHTIMPLSIAKKLGIKIDGHKQYFIQSATGHRAQIKTGEALLKLDDGKDVVEWTTQLGFIPFDQSRDEVTLLGHIGCLEFFTATFDGKAHELTLKPNTRLPKR